MIQSAGVVIYKGVAYLAVNAQMEGGAFLQIAPVFTADLSVDALSKALEQVVEAGHPRIPALSPGEWKRRKDPVLAATGARSWSRLAQQGASYGVAWEQDAVMVYVSTSDEKGRLINRPEDVYTLPKGASLHAIAAAILADVQGRPEILA